MPARKTCHQYQQAWSVDGSVVVDDDVDDDAAVAADDDDDDDVVAAADAAAVVVAQSEVRESDFLAVGWVVFVGGKLSAHADKLKSEAAAEQQLLALYCFLLNWAPFRTWDQIL